MFQIEKHIFSTRDRREIKTCKRCLLGGGRPPTEPWMEGSRAEWGLALGGKAYGGHMLGVGWSVSTIGWENLIPDASLLPSQSFAPQCHNARIGKRRYKWDRMKSPEASTATTAPY